MLEIRGDLWKLPLDVYPALKLITTNGQTRKDGAAIMGRGCAKQARDTIPGIDYKLGELLRKYGNRVFRLAPLPDGSHLGSFPVKSHWKDYADPELIECSAHQLVELADNFGYKAIFLPRPGAGNGKLNYHDDVKPVLEQILTDDRFRVISF